MSSKTRFELRIQEELINSLKITSIEENYSSTSDLIVYLILKGMSFDIFQEHIFLDFLSEEQLKVLEYLESRINELKRIYL